MATRSATITVDAELAQAYSSAPKTKQQKALSAMRQVLRAAPVQATCLSKRETELFLKINHTLPLDEQRRYDELKQKLEDETLTQAEHTELMRFVEQYQDLSAERMEAVLELATLRGLTPQEMLKQLGVDPRRYAR